MRVLRVLSAVLLGALGIVAVLRGSSSVEMDPYLDPYLDEQLRLMVLLDDNFDTTDEPDYVKTTHKVFAKF